MRLSTFTLFLIIFLRSIDESRKLTFVHPRTYFDLVNLQDGRRLTSRAISRLTFTSNEIRLYYPVEYSKDIPLINLISKIGTIEGDNNS